MDINAVQKMVENDGIIFLSYGGYLSQTLIAGMTEALEKEAEHNGISMTASNNIFTIFIELSQNMMNYSKTLNNESLRAQGLILVSKDDNYTYHIHSQNIVSTEDKNKIEPKLLEIQSLDKDGIKKRYRELRKSGQNTHDKGGGIGFYEIAKKCDHIDFNFTYIQEDRYYFHMKTTILTKKGN
ncbi:MAG: hypothetical protein ACI9TV_001841 [Sulfurimonas sp.]|jgi:hypothetical protein|uniref:SiaB family protein kinase n=1 Tax=Sulfurimonas sp. TaxID=2022749 RepID=UPI0039E69615